MKESYLLMSDIHFHNWTSFSTTNHMGVNDRLQIIIDEIRRAAFVHECQGGKKNLVIAGDVFHQRGSVQTSVLNPVIDLFKNMVSNFGYSIHILSGNHDLETKESRRLSSSITALEGRGIRAYSNSIANIDLKLVFVPWFSSVAELKEELESLTVQAGELKEYDLIIHAPVDDVVIGLPSHGLDSNYLSSLGFGRVFSGHYHNHKDFGNNVWSIGALTHQTFSDINSKAGFLSVFDDRVVYHASHAPKFIDINSENIDDAQMLVDGNYVRCRISLFKESDVAEIRKQFEDWGAKGVVVNQIKNTTVPERSVSTGSMSLEQFVSNYIKLVGYGSAVELMCFGILKESSEVFE